MMVHRLAKPGDTKSAVGLNPMAATLRYRCACGNQEVLSISTVFDATVPEDTFVWTMHQLYRDMMTEVAQHLKETT